MVLGPLAGFGSTPAVGIGEENEKNTPVYLQQATKRLAGHLGDAIADGYRLSPGGFSIAGGWMKQSRRDWVEMYNIDLTKGTRYRFIASGDNDTEDLDLRIVDGDQNVLAKDTTTASEAIVDFSPRVSARYHIELRLYASRRNLPCVCLTAALTR